MTVRVVLESTRKRAFASALDWPGWSRGAKTDELAIQALLDYAPRYARVARRASVAFTAPGTVDDLDVVERLEGGGGTDFGVPSASASAEAEPLPPADLKQLLALLRAAWATFDASVDAAAGVNLRLGPRGGGRQTPKIVEHVREAESAYLHQLGSKPPKGASLPELHDAFVEALTARVGDQPVPNANRVKKPWSPRYAVRRSAWHSLDHAWEVEDRST